MRSFAVLAVVALALVGCANVPKPVMPADVATFGQEMSEPAPAASTVEPPAIEPVEPPLPAQEPPPAAANTPQPAEQPSAPPPAVLAAPAPAEATEDQQMIALLSDLQRFGTMQNDELKREFAAATQALSRQRSDVNRVRLAVLYTLLRTSPQDDQRALQLFENVAKSAPPASPIRHLSAVLQAQVVERQRAVRDEQQKADAAIQKLEALREMERSLLRDRVRSGGGGGGGSAGGSGR